MTAPTTAALVPQLHDELARRAVRPEAAGAESDTVAGTLGEAGCAAELDPYAWRNESGAVDGEPEGDRCADAGGEGRE